MEIIDGRAEEIIDPTGILDGRRFECQLTVKLDEEDELYDENGTGLKILFALREDGLKILNYQFFEKATEKMYDVEWDDEEQDVAEQYCKEHLLEN